MRDAAPEHVGARQDTGSSPSDQTLGPGLLRSAWQFRWLVVAVTLVWLVGGAVLAASLPRQFEAYSTVLLANPNQSPVSGDPRGNNVEPFAYASTQAFIMRSGPVLAEANEVLQPPLTVDEVSDVFVASESDALLLTVRVRSSDADRALAIANALPTAYETVALQATQDTAAQAAAELQEAADSLESELSELDEALAGASGADTAALEVERAAVAAQIAEIANNRRRVLVESSLFGSGVVQREEAIVSAGPVEPNTARIVLASGVLGLIAGLGAAWLLNTRREHLLRRRDPSLRLDAPVLGEVPDRSTAGATSLPSLHQPRGADAEAYRFILTALSFRVPAQGAVVLLTGAEDSLTSPVALNLAISAAVTGRRTVLIDAHPDGTGSAHLWRNGSAGSTRDWLAGVGEDVASNARLHTMAMPLQVTTVDERLTGQAGGAPSLESVSRGVLGADLVIVDAPSVISSAHALELAGFVDGVVTVVSPATTEDQMDLTRRRLDLAAADIVGVIVVEAEGRRSPVSLASVAAVTSRRGRPRSQRESASTSGDPAPSQR